MATPTTAQIQKLWEEIVDAVYERDTYYDEHPKRAQMGPPATPAELAELERHLGVRLPPSYAAFLSLYNGVEGFFDDVPLLSTSELISGRGEWREDIAEIDPDLAKFPFAGSGTSAAGHFVFDTRTVDADGEMPVIHLAADGDKTRYKSFVAYLRKFLKVVKETIAAERADRANLKD